MNQSPFLNDDNFFKSTSLNERGELMVKAAGHKYIKRTGVKGKYKYWYRTPQGKLISSDYDFRNYTDKRKRTENEDTDEVENVSELSDKELNDLAKELGVNPSGPTKREMIRDAQEAIRKRDKSKKDLSNSEDTAKHLFNKYGYEEARIHAKKAFEQEKKRKNLKDMDFWAGVYKNLETHEALAKNKTKKGTSKLHESANQYALDQLEAENENDDNFDEEEYNKYYEEYIRKNKGTKKK